MPYRFAITVLGGRQCEGSAGFNDHLVPPACCARDYRALSRARLLGKERFVDWTGSGKHAAIALQVIGPAGYCASMGFHRKALQPQFADRTP
jgi:hypothetical protein